MSLVLFVDQSDCNGSCFVVGLNVQHKPKLHKSPYVSVVCVVVPVSELNNARTL